MNKKDLISKIEDSIYDSILDNDSNFIDTYLEDNGYCLSEIKQIADKNQKKHSFLVKGLINKQKDEVRLEKAATYFKTALDESMNKPVNFLMDLIRNNKFSIQYRNFEKLDMEEIKQMIKDQNLLEYLEDLEENDE